MHFKKKWWVGKIEISDLKPEEKRKEVNIAQESPALFPLS